MRGKDQTIQVHPVLTGFATPRTGGDAQIGRYCEQREVWVVDTPDGPRPLVAFCDAVSQTSTLTEVNAEMDDTDIHAGLDFVTHTSVKTESDDASPRCAGQDLGTFTDVKAESDDADRLELAADLGTSTRILAESDDLDREAAMALLAVTTKTHAQVERDDNAVGLDMYQPSFGARIAPLRIH